MKFFEGIDPIQLEQLSFQAVSLGDMQNYDFMGFKIKRVGLKGYHKEKTPGKNDFEFFTAEIETDKGTVELFYSKATSPQDSLENIRDFLISNLGLSALISRGIIALKGRLEKMDS